MRRGLQNIQEPGLLSPLFSLHVPLALLLILPSGPQLHWSAGEVKAAISPLGDT